ncbi:unnamed protein product [Linum trigynum]|uniref:Myb-like domain-containing protein n=1 Tax=Linum trigynum TaxID=586398 RepID=A0AAV2E0D0_9ROSI
MEALYPHFYMSSHHLLNDNSSSSQSSEWTREENKAFESALDLYGEHDPHRWLNVAAMIPGKSVSDVIEQYREWKKTCATSKQGASRSPVTWPRTTMLLSAWTSSSGPTSSIRTESGPWAPLRPPIRAAIDPPAARRCILVGQVRRFDDEGRRR